MNGTVHVVGAGMAGLACAVRLAARGRRVVLHEAADHGGGRCRSYPDRRLGCRVDNGNHLILAGNDEINRYLETIGAQDGLVGPDEPGFPFLDLTDGSRFALRPNRGRLPWWPFDSRRRLPATRPTDYLDALRLRAGPEATVAARLAGTPLYDRLWRPLAIAVLNTPPEEASARLLWHVLTEVFGKGGAAAAARLPRIGLSETFVDPALTFLAARGEPARLGRRLRAIELGDRVRRLEFTDGDEPLGESDHVILAIPGPVATALVPAVTAPDDWRPIVNLHFGHAAPGDHPPLLGLLGGTAEWLFAKPGHMSVTISAADAIVDQDAEVLATRVWTEVARAIGQPQAPLPVWRVVKERRATFAATPAQLRRRPGPRTRFANLWLAGDWTDTGLPSTIEGAVLSGHRVADLLAPASGAR